MSEPNPSNEPRRDRDETPRPSADDSPRSRFLPMVIGASCALLALLVVAGVRAYGDLADARAREAELEAELSDAETRVQELAGRIDRIENDDDALERVAREELGMVFPDEYVVLLPEETETPATGDAGRVTSDPSSPSP